MNHITSYKKFDKKMNEGINQFLSENLQALIIVSLLGIKGFWLLLKKLAIKFGDNLNIELDETKLKDMTDNMIEKIRHMDKSCNNFEDIQQEFYSRIESKQITKISDFVKTIKTLVPNN